MPIYIYIYLPLFAKKTKRVTCQPPGLDSQIFFHQRLVHSIITSISSPEKVSAVKGRHAFGHLCLYCLQARSLNASEP